MDEIENAHPAGGGTGAWSDPTTLTITPYHASGGNQTDFRLKRLADTADRSHFPRIDLPAVPEDDSTESTNLCAVYDTEDEVSTSGVEEASTRFSWSDVDRRRRCLTINSLARRLRTLFATDPDSVTRLGSSTDLASELISMLAPGAGYVRPRRIRETLSAALDLGVIEQVDGRLIVHTNDEVIDGYPNAAPSISNLVFAKVVLRDGLVCQLCFGAITDSFGLDHIVPVADGGLDTVDNLRVTHVKCNRSRAKEVRMQRYGTYGVKRTPKGATP
jgi:hypothetical protein